MKRHLMQMLVGTSVLVGGLISDVGVGAAQVRGGHGGYRGGYAGVPGDPSQTAGDPGGTTQVLPVAPVVVMPGAPSSSRQVRPASHPATQAAPPPRQHRDVLQALNRSRQPDEGAEGATRHAARPGETRAGRRFLCAHATAPLGWEAGSLRDRPAAFPVTLPVGALT